MIGSISKQPDYKLFVEEGDLLKLESDSLVLGKVLNHSTNELVDLILKRDLSLKDGITRDGIQTVLVSNNIIQELGEKGFIGGLRLNGNTVKITLIVKERLKNLGISYEDKMTLGWVLEDLEELIKSN